MNMDEKKTEEKTETSEEKGADENTDDRDASNKEDSETAMKLEKAVAASKEENDRREKLIEREEKLLTRKEALAALGGGSPAGDRPGKKEESPGDYTKKIMAGENGE